jgi:hypothetical protein
MKIEIFVADNAPAFDRIYSTWLRRVVMNDGKAVIRRSAKCYLRAIKEH